MTAAPEKYVKIAHLRRGEWRAFITLTAGRCREIVAAMRVAGGLDKPSRVNKTFTRLVVLDIFTSALATRADDAPVSVPSCQNILREAALPLGEVGKRWRDG